MEVIKKISLKYSCIFFFIFCFLALSSCKMKLSMSGTDLGDAKTVYVDYFQNNAPLAKPTYCNSMTEALKDMLTSQTALSLGTRGADLVFEGSVTAYAVTPIAIQSGTDMAAFNRLTITVSVKFTNVKNEKYNFETTFTRYADYPSSNSLNTVEDGLIKTINDQLTQDIFNKALINW
jgi:hypothetical protein